MKTNKHEINIQNVIETTFILENYFKLQFFKVFLSNVRHFINKTDNQVKKLTKNKECHVLYYK